jgi:MFS family permease
MTQTSVTLFLPLLLQVVHQVPPPVINFLSIVISMGWTTGSFTVSGWSGKRERIALASGPVIATTGLACLTAVALLPGLVLMTVSAFVMGIGIGVYNVHLVARAMDSVTSDEHRSTASALASVRSIGTAFAAAIAGVVANIAGRHCRHGRIHVLLHTVRTRRIADVPLYLHRPGQAGGLVLGRRTTPCLVREPLRTSGLRISVGCGPGHGQRAGWTPSGPRS